MSNLSFFILIIGAIFNSMVFLLYYLDPEQETFILKLKKINKVTHIFDIVAFLMIGSFIFELLNHYF